MTKLQSFLSNGYSVTAVVDNKSYKVTMVGSSIRFGRKVATPEQLATAEYEISYYS